MICVANCVARTELCVASVSLAPWPTMAAYGAFGAGEGDDGGGKEEPRQHLLI